ncbi:MAG TPA: T9SS type A sorting domain-containing protein, partial [Ignavibacteriaceae bacterium]|nr:T9SS type A sorting domain-containing protein [Ignavibacteriaceae bacterium]
FNLSQNYPNPFNPTTDINFTVPEAGNVKLAVYNALGQEVAVLVNGMVTAGLHTATFNASSLPSGAYIYKLQSNNSVMVKKMMLMK